jgi:hypothetical protein
VLIAGAVAIVVPAFRAMARAGTSFRTERPTTAIVTDGPFRYTRNPIYVALTLLYLGIGTVLNALWVLLLIVPVMVLMQLGVIAREERYLERKFGDEYLRYKARVRRGSEPEFAEFAALPAFNPTERAAVTTPPGSEKGTVARPAMTKLCPNAAKRRFRRIRAEDRPARMFPEDRLSGTLRPRFLDLKILVSAVQPVPAHHSLSI